MDLAAHLQAALEAAASCNTDEESEISEEE